MQCASQRTYSDNHNVSGGEKCYLAKKSSSEQDNCGTSSKESEISHVTRASTDKRCPIVTLIAPDLDGNWRLIALPVQYFNSLGSGCQVKMEGMDPLSQNHSKSFIGHGQKTPKLSPLNVVSSTKSFVARNLLAPNVQHQPQNKVLTNKLTKRNKFSNNSDSQGSSICGSSALIPKGSNDINSSDRIVDGSTESKVVKKNTKKKGKKKRKQRRRNSYISGPNEPEVISEEYSLESSTSETRCNNDVDNMDGLVSCTTSSEVPYSDGRYTIIDIEGDRNGGSTCSESPSICRSYMAEVDVSESMMSQVLNMPEEPSLVVSEFKSDQNLSNGRVEKTHYSEVSYDDINLKSLSDVSDIQMDYVSMTYNNDDGGNSSPDNFGRENYSISPPEFPDFSSKEAYLSHGNFVNGAVDMCSYTTGNKHDSQAFSKSDGKVVASGKRAKKIKAAPKSVSISKIENLGSSYCRTGKENNHVWLKVEKNDATECNLELNKASAVCSQSDVTVNHKRYLSIPEKNAFSRNGEKRQTKDKAMKKLKRKKSSHAKQDANSYPSRGSHSTEIGSDGYGNNTTQTRDKLDFADQVDDRKGVADISEACCGIKTSGVVTMSSEVSQSSKAREDNLQGLETVSSPVFALKSKKLENQNNSLPIPHASSENTNPLERQYSVYLPHLLFNKVPQMEKQTSSCTDTSNQTYVSGSVLQKWIPVGMKNPDLASSLSPEISSFEHFSGTDSEGRALRSIFEEKVDTDLTSSVSDGISSFENSSGTTADDWALRSSVEEKADTDLTSSVSDGISSLENSSGTTADDWALRSSIEEKVDERHRLRNSHTCIPDANRNKQVTVPHQNGKIVNHSISKAEIDLNKIAKAVDDALRIQLASEAVQMAIGCPVAEFERLLHLSAPVIHCSNSLMSCKTCFQDQSEGQTLFRHQGPNISLGCLWEWYYKHGSYGLEVRAHDYKNSKRMGVDPFAFRAYFVPYLSAVQMFKKGKSRSIQNTTSEKTSKSIANLPVYSLLFPKPRSLKTSLPSTNGACKSDIFLGSTKESSSVVQDDMIYSCDPELLFEYFESEQPQQRLPLYEKVQELVEGDMSSHSAIYGDPTILNSINLHELHPSSWYSVAWYPIYRIPDGNLHAAFLTYHSLGHLVHRATELDNSSTDASAVSIVSPVVGLQSYNAQDECWFRPRHFGSSQKAENQGLNPSEILKERLRTLEETSSCMARAVVRKGNQTSINKHPDYEFFLSRRR